MRLFFTLRVATNWGQRVLLCPVNEKYSAIEMACIVSGEWTAEADAELFADGYFYQKQNPDGTFEREVCSVRFLPSMDEVCSLSVADYWTGEGGTPSCFCASGLFAGFSSEIADNKCFVKNGDVLFRALPLLLPEGAELFLSGEAEALGCWDVEKAIRLQKTNFATWSLKLSLSQLPVGLAYKWFVRYADGYVRWQDGENQLFIPNENADSHLVCLNVAHLSLPFRTSGVVIPIFSLRTDDCFGIGDFLALKEMADWAVLTGQRIIQTLPVNDTSSYYTWKDSYPYNAVSVHALHPIYLGLSEFPLKNEDAQHRFRERAEVLNRLPDVDYESVICLKMEYIDCLFAERGEETMASEAFRQFQEQNEEWLFSYACHAVLRTRHQNPDFRAWGEFATYQKDKLEGWLVSDSDAWFAKNKIYFTQFLLDQQLRKVADYMRRKGVILKGDIPIGVNPKGVDAWTFPHLFNCGMQSGAPPDDFAVFGQNWGFPTYNWATMAQDGFRWWRGRLMKMADYFSAYRIDHILGFFRIWEIPTTAVHALLGHFSPSIPLSISEIADFGFDFQHEQAIPFMSDEDARTHFDNLFEKALPFLSAHENGFRLHPDFDTQRKIVNYFRQYPDNQLEERLLLFADEVLFVPDGERADHFHPRITAYSTYRFVRLNDDEKANFYRLYDHFYYHRHNDFWAKSAMEKLPALLRSAPMLACGEDLGMIPACVSVVMKELGILSLEIDRMPKTYGVAFEPLNGLPEMSVCTTSTHDMSPLRLWWEENESLRTRYFHEVLGESGEVPNECTVVVSHRIIERHLQSPAMLVVLPLQDWFSFDEVWRTRPACEEQINVPADSNHYWCYRMHLSVEQLLERTETNEAIRQMLADAHRS